MKTQKLDDGSSMPILVIRPSIVGAMWKDPLPGWTDNINGATGVFAAVSQIIISRNRKQKNKTFYYFNKSYLRYKCQFLKYIVRVQIQVGKGVLTNMCGSESSKADIIPVDIVANMIIVATAHYIYKKQVAFLNYNNNSEIRYNAKDHSRCLYMLTKDLLKLTFELFSI